MTTTTSRHLTPRFWWCVLTGLGALALAVEQQSTRTFAFALPFLFVVAASFIDGWWPEPPTVDVRLSSSRLIEGDLVTAIIQLRSDDAIPFVEIELQPSSTVQAQSSLHHVRAMAGGREEVIEATLACNRWGVAGLDWLTIVTRDRLGLSEVVRRVPLTAVARVHPPTERLLSLVPLTRTRPVSGDHRSKQRGEGTELAEVRAHRPDDPARRIHPSLSARRGTPMVLERHPDRSADVVLYVDAVQDIGVHGDSTLRWTVSAATALTQRHQRSMDRVGIIDRGAGVRWLPPSLGRRALHGLVDALLSTAVLQARAEDLPTVPFAKIPTAATVFAISPLLSAVVTADLVELQRRGHQVIVIQPSSPTPPNVSLRAVRIFRIERELRRRTLTRSGVVVVPWNPEEPLEPTLRRMSRTIGRLQGAK